MKLSKKDREAITIKWEETSARKSELIEKKIARTITRAEYLELAHLKRLTEERAELYAPLPTAEMIRQGLKSMKSEFMIKVTGEDLPKKPLKPATLKRIAQGLKKYLPKGRYTVQTFWVNRVSKAKSKL